MGLERLATYDPNAYERFDNNLADMLVDALNGDTKVLDMPEIQALGVRNIRAALEWLATSNIDKDYKNLITNEGWRLIYVRKPPTPEEYLTPEWIGVQAEGLWPNVRKAFCEFMSLDPLSPKRGLALSTSIGWGKDQPIDSNIITEKIIKLELENGTKLEIPSNDILTVTENGKDIKMSANELLTKDLVSIDFPQSMIKRYTK
jgi:hypothetical protein